MLELLRCCNWFTDNAESLSYKKNLFEMYIYNSLHHCLTKSLIILYDLILTKFILIITKFSMIIITFSFSYDKLNASQIVKVECPLLSKTFAIIYKSASIPAFRCCTKISKVLLIYTLSKRIKSYSNTRLYSKEIFFPFLQFHSINKHCRCQPLLWPALSQKTENLNENNNKRHDINKLPFLTCYYF